MDLSKDKKVIKKKSALREWIEALIIAGILAIFLRTFFFQIYKIPTTSMVPTLMPGDKIFVSKLVYGPKVPFSSLRLPGFGKPQRGDIAVFIPPHEKEKNIFIRKHYIKRLVGLEGDRILIEDGNLYINGKIVIDPRMARNYYYNQGDYGKDDKEIIVPPETYFFLGDNSISSLDSRTWGFVDQKEVVGKAIFIWWPFRRIAMIE